MSHATRRFRGYSEVADPTGENLHDQVLDQHRRLVERMAGVRRLVAVASGKGGVGKSAITANLAAIFSVTGKVRVQAALVAGDRKPEPAGSPE